MNWAEATDDQLRRAAAGVCEFWYSDDYVYLGSFYPPPIGWPHKTGRFGSGSYILCRAAKWRPHKNRDDLALVFKAAWERINGADAPGWCCQDERVVDAWNAAMGDWWCAPRLALVGILELLESFYPGEPK